jgi:amidophosphoribosyltransferase
MSKMGEFVAFRATLELLKEKNIDIEEIIGKEILSTQENIVQRLYAQFSDDEISEKIAEMIRKKANIRAEVKVIYQSVENLHKACPNHLGDWYFTGNYPTPGGYKVVNKALMNFIEGKLERAY